MEPKSLPHALANNLCLVVVFALSFFLPMYVWFTPLQKIDSNLQIGISFCLCLLFAFFMKLAVYVYKNIEKEKSKVRGKNITILYMVAGLINFVLYSYYSSQTPWMPNNSIQLATLTVMGFIAFKILKKSPSKTVVELPSAEQPNAAA